MRRFLCLLAVLILGIAAAGCRQEPTKRYTADELTGMSGSELLAVLSDNGLSLPDGVTMKAGETATFYTNGMATMSIPAQMNAIGVVK